ncbi:hypothetical protein TTHERM_000787423 (macronuclear) [Tetrahymena thermophila SB210]|uniref:Uncharacterized protein n=1 Tax=Tetrahymena thermophila (strain SB210) TaxID=312017 RepID=W7XFM0_TETTS|nr:hypothetical protein TTHERM_000787423 [Tetrahymena thermophila SB210]EWS72796.1 hypothetical protein TTHERM_000787423 [Tetrahymena thermophila SB210]|eukprot:XP_012654683.1 hypothetical protein TTHERM_000787423 [Tetrahymena thermophila SB210]
MAITEFFKLFFNGCTIFFKNVHALENQAVTLLIDISDEAFYELVIVSFFKVYPFIFEGIVKLSQINLIISLFASRIYLDLIQYHCKQLFFTHTFKGSVIDRVWKATH